MAIKTIYGTTNNQYITSAIDWESTANFDKNESTVTAKLYYKKSKSSTSGTSGTIKGKITINSVASEYSKSISIPANNTWVLVHTFSTTVKHNNDGTKSITISATGGISGTSFTSTTLSGTAKLEDIPRAATTTNATNFTDEQGPTVTFSNPGGFTIYPYINFFDANGVHKEQFYDDSSSDITSPYTWEFTDEQKERIRIFLKDRKSCSVTVGVDTYKNGTKLGNSSLWKTCSIVNADPLITPTVEDVNETTKALTGDKNTFVKYFSNAGVSVGGVALKSATIASQQVVNGGKTLASDTGTIEGVESGTFVFSATDSRGNTVSETLERDLIEYVKPSCSLDIGKTSVDDTQAEILVTISGKCFNGRFGAKNNDVKVQLRYKANDEDYSNWSNVDFTVNETDYIASATLAGLDYESLYTIQARIVDSLMSAESNEEKVKITPIFHWGKDDFAFNVPVSIQGQQVSDFVIEQGMDGEWAYQKWASGKAECWCEKSITSSPNIAWGSAYYAKHSTYPFPTGLFIAPPQIWVQSSEKSGGVWATYASPTKDETGYIYSISPTSYNNLSVKMHIKATGTWK